MRPVRVELEEFICFSSATIEFPDRGLILVSGSRGNPGSSNGAGKSSIFEALHWALLGSTVRGSKAADVARFGQKQCSVSTLWALPDGRELFVRRSRPPALEVAVDGVALSAHVAAEMQSKLDELLFAGQPDLFALAAFAGRRYASLARMSPKQRASVLERLAQFDRWDRARKLARSSATNTSRGLDSLHEQIARLEARHSSLVSRAQEPVQELQLPSKPQVPDVEELRREEAELSEMLSSVDTRLAQLGASKPDIKALRRGVCPTCLRPVDKQLLDRLLTKVQLVDSEIEELRTLRNDCVACRGALQQQIRQAEAELREYESALARYESAKASALAVKQALLEEAASIDAEIASLRTKARELQFQLDAYSFWVDGFAEISRMLLEQYLALFQEQISLYSQQFGLGPVVLTYGGRSNSLELSVRRGGHLVAAELLSDGESQRLDLACSLAFSVIAPFAPQFRVFDEPLSGLDVEGRDLVFEELVSLAEDNLVFVVDHDPQFTGRFDRILHVTRVDSSSTVEWL